MNGFRYLKLLRCFPYLFSVIIAYLIVVFNVSGYVSFSLGSVVTLLFVCWLLSFKSSIRILDIIGIFYIVVIASPIFVLGIILMQNAYSGACYPVVHLSLALLSWSVSIFVAYFLGYKIWFDV